MTNTIKVDYEELTRIKNTIANIALEAIALASPLQQSMGKATDTEKEIIDLLTQICKNDIPLLMEETTKLLEVIPRSFHDAEDAISSIFNGATNATGAGAGVASVVGTVKNGTDALSGSVGAAAAAISGVTK